MKTTSNSIEPLEARIAPAGFIHTYTDVDGDLVSVKFSKGEAGEVNFDEPLTGPLPDGRQLDTIDLQGNQAFKGTNITVTARPQLIHGEMRGDGLANVGLIEASGGGGIDLGAISIDGNLEAIHVGNATTKGGVKSLTVLSMRGGPGDMGLILGKLGALKSGGDIDFMEVGSAGTVTVGGELERFISAGDIGSVKVGGDIDYMEVGSVGTVTVGGRLGIFTSAGDIGSVKVGGDVSNIGSAGKIGAVTVGGSLGSFGAAGDIGPVKVAGSAFGITSVEGKLAAVTVGGSAVSISGKTGMGPVTIGGDFDGLIRTTDGPIASVTIGGDLDGGQIKSKGVLGPVKIGGDVRGGTLTEFGSIKSDSGLTSVLIGGSLLGGSAAGSGQIFSAGDIGAVKIMGDVIGGSISGSQQTLDKTGYIEGARIKSVFIGGSMITGGDFSDSGDLTRNASIRAVNDIGSITVLGSLVGKGNANDVDSTPVIITARGKASLPASNDVAIGSITVHGSVELANIIAGYNVDFGAVNADAQIGSVTIFGDWISGYILAGVQDAGDGFGNSGDTKIAGAGVKDLADKGGKGAISKIASIIIKGNAIGPAGTTPAFYTFAIESQQLGKIKVGNATVPLLAGAGNDLMGAGQAVGQARPLGSSLGTTISDGFGFHAIEVPVAP